MTGIRGVMKRFHSDKGYGFITPLMGGSDVFVHISAVRNSGLSEAPPEGTKVEYEVEQGDRGPRATKVSVVL